MFYIGAWATWAGFLLVEVAHAEQAIYTTEGSHSLLTDTFSDPAVQAPRTDRPGQDQTHAQSRQLKVGLLEGGYTSEIRHLEKVESKRQQHKTLLKALEMQGFSVQS